MIKNFDEYIKEGLWKTGFDRSKNNEVRKEDGKKVNTPLGELVLKNTDLNYEEIFDNLLDINEYGYINHANICKFREISYMTAEEKSNLLKGQCEYDYIVGKQKPHTDSLVISFETYETMCEYDNQFEETCCKDDYISICRCIVDAFKDVDLEFASQRAGGNGEYVLNFANENETYNIEQEDEDVDDYENWFFDYKNSFDDEFARSSSIISWSFAGYGINIGIEMSYDSLKNYNTYREFTRKWFGLD